MMKRFLSNIFFLVSAMSSMAQVYQYPMNKMVSINGKEVLFSFTPSGTPYEVPTSSREFLEKSFMHKEMCLPPYKSSPTSFLAVNGIDRLDSVLIETGDKVEKILFISDTMSVLQGQQFFDAEGKLTAEVSLTYMANKETERQITTANGETVEYKIGPNGPLSMSASTKMGSEAITWVYKNSMVSSASQTGSRGRESASFSYTPQRKLSSIKWKTSKGSVETLFEYSDYESSVVNPIYLVKNENYSSKLCWDVYDVMTESKGQTLLRVNTLQEKKIYDINGGNRELVSSYLLTFKPFANSKGGAKNLLSHLAIEGLTDNYQESYDYTTDLKISKVVKPDKMIEYEYNGLGNIAKVIVTPGEGDKSEIVFYYTNIEEERIRLEEERAKAEAERKAREEEEKRLKEEAEAAEKAAAEAAAAEASSQEVKETPAAEGVAPAESDKVAE